MKTITAPLKNVSELSFPDTSSTYTLLHARAVLDGRIVEDAALVVSNGIITAVGSADAIQPEGNLFDLSGYLLFPGLIDTHIHGALGRDFMDSTEESCQIICRAHAAGGTTALLGTTVTETIPGIQKALQAIDRSRKNNDPLGARLLGAHVEGPYFSKEKRGAHDVNKIVNPTLESAEALISAGGPIRIMTFAPELPGTDTLLKVLHSHHILGSGGHSDAWEPEVRVAFEQGMTRVTHTFNCMSTMRKRGALREAGLVEFAMSEPCITCELIADGVHVAPTLMKMLYQAKGVEGLCVITDATAGYGLQEDDRFNIAGIKCKISGGFCVTEEDGVLAGGSASMLLCVQNMIRLVGVPMVDAVRMASINPARALGLEHEIGSLKVNRKADFLILNPALDLLATYIDGKPVYRSK